MLHTPPTHTHTHLYFNTLSLVVSLTAVLCGIKRILSFPHSLCQTLSLIQPQAHTHAHTHTHRRTLTHTHIGTHTHTQSVKLGLNIVHLVPPQARQVGLCSRSPMQTHTTELPPKSCHVCA